MKEDEGLATPLNDLMQDRYRTFLYSKAQGKLVGTDGEKTFNNVFGQEARTVAIWFRKEWGQTAWTRIEETAIRNRAHDQGYNFATFIVTEPGARLPQWVPKVRIWYDLPRFGLEQKDEFHRSYQGVTEATAACNRLFAGLKANAELR